MGVDTVSAARVERNGAEIPATMAIAGFNNTPLRLKRDIVPSLALQRQIFPMIEEQHGSMAPDEWRAHCDRVMLDTSEIMNQLNKRPWPGRRRRLEAAKEDTDAFLDVVRLDFLHLLLWFRRVILQDASLLERDGGENAIMRYNVFRSSEFKEFQARLLDSISKEHEPASERSQGQDGPSGGLKDHSHELKCRNHDLDKAMQEVNGDELFRDQDSELSHRQEAMVEVVDIRSAEPVIEKEQGVQVPLLHTPELRTQDHLQRKPVQATVSHKPQQGIQDHPSQLHLVQASNRPSQLPHTLSSEKSQDLRERQQRGHQEQCQETPQEHPQGHPRGQDPILIHGHPQGRPHEQPMEYDQNPSQLPGRLALRSSTATATSRQSESSTCQQLRHEFEQVKQDQQEQIERLQESLILTMQQLKRALNDQSRVSEMHKKDIQNLKRQMQEERQNAIRAVEAKIATQMNDMLHAVAILMKGPLGLQPMSEEDEVQEGVAGGNQLSSSRVD